MYVYIHIGALHRGPKYGREVVRERRYFGLFGRKIRLIIGCSIGVQLNIVYIHEV